MVKSLDENDPDLIDHVGWRLWRANRAWKTAFDTAMVALGHNWFTQARAGVLAHLDRDGTRQSDVAERMGLSKQAVQQFVDGLVQDGIVARIADPTDRRGRIVVFTAAGKRVLKDANRVKRQIEAVYRAKLGARDFERLADALRRLDADD